MTSRPSVILERNAPPQEGCAALDYQYGAAYNATPVVKLDTDWDRIGSRRRRVQSSTRRPGSSERCWTALPIACAGARWAKPARALAIAADSLKPRSDGPVRFG